MINYLSEFNYLSIKLITCQNKLIADQRMIDDRGQSPHNTATTVKILRLTLSLPSTGTIGSLHLIHSVNRYDLTPQLASAPRVALQGCSDKAEAMRERRD